jgi:cation-transporting ATPase E
MADDPSAIVTPEPRAVGPPRDGLSEAEATARAATGRANVDSSKQRTDGDVVRANTITFFNVVLASLIIALLAVGEFSDGLFVGFVVFANVAVATMQELQATRRLRELRALTAPRATVVRGGVERSIPAVDVVEGDLLHLEPGDQVVVDGHIVAHSAEIDESLLTGESDPVQRGASEELRSGSFCVAGDCYYTAERVGTEAYAVRLTAESRELVRRETPLTLRFNRLLRVLLITTGALAAVLFIQFNIAERGFAESLKATTATVTTVVPAGLLLGMTVVTAVGALRVSRSGAIVQDIYGVEALNYVDVIGLDKTGTLTTNRLTLEAIEWRPGGGEDLEGWLAAFVVAADGESKTASTLGAALEGRSNGAKRIDQVPFSSARRWSAATLQRASDRMTLVLGAPETVLNASLGLDAEPMRRSYEAASERGLRGVVLAKAQELPDPEAPLARLEPLALITLGDELRQEVRGAFELMAELEIAPKVISGDNPDTVAALVEQLGVPLAGGAIAGSELPEPETEAFADAVEANSIFGRITPAQKAAIVDALQARGHFVAMVGDGANDVHALRSADVAVAMESGTATARGVAGIVLLEDSFAALIRGAQEATFVLGNAARLSKLFIAKSVYAYLLIFVTNLLGLDFPFLPRQGGVMSLLTLGIPAVFVSISVPPPGSGRDFTNKVLGFALPAGFALAISAILVQLLVEGILSRSVEEARTLVSITIVLTGIAYVVEVIGLDRASWRHPLRPGLTFMLAAALVGLLFVFVNIGWVSDFFAFSHVGAFGWTVTITATAAALAGQYLLTRHWRDILRVLTAEPSADQLPRGRSV